jgi:AAA domain
MTRASRRSPFTLRPDLASIASLAVLDIVVLPDRLIEVVIALSIAAVAAHASGRLPVRLRDRVRQSLDGLPSLATQKTAFGTGLRFLPVDHVGNVAAAPEEAERVAREIRAMLGGSWTNRDGQTRSLTETDFMVVAPYNMQVRLLRRTLEAAALAGVPVGTVDKFPGREAPVIFYSMATSSAEDVPRTLDFLFSRNRLNVAVSRAMCLACIVASPRLLESRARTIEQMRLINALCRFAEMAAEQAG